MNDTETITDQVVCEYIEYESLPEISNSINISELFESESWKHNFQGISLLRSINKYNKSQISEHLFALLPKIYAYIDSPRSQLCKNALIFISEVFNSYNSSLIPIIPQLFQMLSLKSANEKAFIRNASFKSLENLSLNYYCEPEVVDLFKSNCFHKSAVISETSAKLLKNFLKKIEEKQSFELCLEIQECKRQGIKVIAEEHLKFLYETWTEFHENLSKLEENRKIRIMDLFSAKKKRSSLRDEIEKQKALVNN